MPVGFVLETLYKILTGAKIIGATMALKRAYKDALQTRLLHIPVSSSASPLGRSPGSLVW